MIPASAEAAVGWPTAPTCLAPPPSLTEPPPPSPTHVSQHDRCLREENSASALYYWRVKFVNILQPPPSLPLSQCDAAPYPQMHFLQHYCNCPCAPVNGCNYYCNGCITARTADPANGCNCFFHCLLTYSQYPRIPLAHPQPPVPTSPTPHICQNFPPPHPRHHFAFTPQTLNVVHM